MQKYCKIRNVEYFTFYINLNYYNFTFTFTFLLHQGYLKFVTGDCGNVGDPEVEP
jgi:hypothetical protein